VLDWATDRQGSHEARRSNWHCRGDDNDDDNDDNKATTTTTSENDSNENNDNSDESSMANCSQPSINDFPSDLFTQTQRRFGAVLFHVAFVVYLFYAIMIVCDDYFMSSLEVIGQV
jgi:hypothetical protein